MNTQSSTGLGMGSHNNYSNNAYGNVSRTGHNESSSGFGTVNAYQSTGNRPVSNYGMGGSNTGKTGPIKPSLLGSSRGNDSGGGEDVMTLQRRITLLEQENIKLKEKAEN